MAQRLAGVEKGQLGKSRANGSLFAVPKREFWLFLTDQEKVLLPIISLRKPTTPEQDF